jgi:carboxyl-terminal processing protease
MLHFKRPLLLTALVLSLACNFIARVLNPVPPTAIPAALTPAYIPPGCDAAAIATLPAATELALPTPSSQSNPEIDQTLQLRVFDDATKVISQVYVYTDFNGRDWNAIMAAHRAKIEAGLSSGDFYDQMQSMVDELGDDHSRFDSPADVAESQAELAGSSQYVGIGISVVPEIDKGRLSIAGIFPGSAADRSGLKIHDSILSVDGLPLVENGQVYTYRVRGPECSAERLTVQSPDQAPRDILLLRHKIEGDLPVDARMVSTSDGSRVGYIMLPSFFDEKIPGEVSDALKNFGHLDGLILDNRMNGGGSSDVVEPVLAYFASGNLGGFKSRASSRLLTVEPNPIENSRTVPMVVLVGEDTVSFGEIFSGVLQDSGRAKIVGQTTLGNVEILHGYDFEDGSRLWIAEETFSPAVSHANWEATGIIPDVAAYAPWDTFTFETDPAVKAALKLLGHT